jgi:hypothetical protein
MYFNPRLSKIHTHVNKLELKVINIHAEVNILIC